jgi:two-component system, sensor histidine kinase and response regulator
MKTPTFKPIEAAVPNVLVVDDTPANLQLLDEMLSSAGYQTRLVTSGYQALTVARRLIPDIMLLDIMMPGMDGLTVCRQFKSDPQLAGIPILFLSAVTTMSEKVRAFDEGGVDYITKPFNMAEVEARVKTHILLQRQKQELAVRNQQLVELELMRDSLVHMLVHDMRSPLFLIELGLHTLREVVPPTPAKYPGALEQISNQVKLLDSMSRKMLDLSRLESGQMPVDIRDNDMNEVAGRIVESISTSSVSVEFKPLPAESALARFDADLTLRVLMNLVENAIKWGGTLLKIRLTLELMGDDVRVVVTDQGPGIPAEFHATIFEKFRQVGPVKSRLGIGLGLAFCKLAVEAQGGKIGVESTPGQGASFWFTLPRVSATG